METWAGKTCWGTATAHLFNISRTGTRFALLLVVWVLALPPLFVHMFMRRRILARFFVLCIILKGETLAIFFGVLAVLSALRGRAGADCGCASFQFWQNGSAFCIVVGFGGPGFTPPPF